MITFFKDIKRFIKWHKFSLYLNEFEFFHTQGEKSLDLLFKSKSHLNVRIYWIQIFSLSVHIYIYSFIYSYRYLQSLIWGQRLVSIKSLLGSDGSVLTCFQILHHLHVNLWLYFAISKMIHNVQYTLWGWNSVYHILLYSTVYMRMQGALS